MPEISERQLRSYVLAEKVAREARYQLSHGGAIGDPVRLADHLIKWATTTGAIKFIRPPLAGEKDGNRS